MNSCQQSKILESRDTLHKKSLGMIFRAFRFLFIADTESIKSLIVNTGPFCNRAGLHLIELNDKFRTHRLKKRPGDNIKNGR